LTPQAYAANLMARFPHLTSMEALAAHESAVAKRSWGNHIVQDRADTSPAVEETRKRRAAWAAILARLNPVTVEAAKEALHAGKSAVRSRMQSLEDGGFATRMEGKPIRWHINTEGRQG